MYNLIVRAKSSRKSALMAFKVNDRVELTSRHDSLRKGHKGTVVTLPLGESQLKSHLMLNSTMIQSV